MQKVNDIVCRFLDDFKGKNHIVFLDNFYTSKILQTNLLSKMIHSCGTLRCNRGSTENFEIKLKGLQKGDSFSEELGDLFITGFADKKMYVSYVLSSIQEQFLKIRSSN